MPRDGKIIAAVLLGTVTLLAWAMGPPAQAETITGSIMWGGLTPDLSPPRSSYV